MANIIHLSGGPMGGQAISTERAFGPAIELYFDQSGKPANRESGAIVAQYRRIDDAHYEFAESRIRVPIVGEAVGGDVWILPGNAKERVTIERKNRRGKVVGKGHFRFKDDSDGMRYELESFEDLSDERDALLEAIDGFYENPNYEIYSMKPGRHDEVPVAQQNGHRKANVDKALATLIPAIWKREWETGGSCQELAEGKKSGWAYIAFSLPEQGHEFESMLKEAGIDVDTEEKPWKLAQKDATGNVCRELSSITLNVYFKPDDINRITLLLSSAAGA